MPYLEHRQHERPMMNTLLLDTDKWDCCLDKHGNLAVARTPYALVQDVACAVRLFLGELWYDTTKGVPYIAQILGKTPRLQLVNERLREAALTVPDVADARVTITHFDRRVIRGTIQITDKQGVLHLVAF